jgi:hypothetical protein
VYPKTKHGGVKLPLHERGRTEEPRYKTGTWGTRKRQTQEGNPKNSLGPEGLSYRMLAVHLEGRGFCAARWGNLGERTIDDLIDGVDRFLLTCATPKNKYLRDEVILRILRVVRKMRRGFPLRNHFWDAHGLSTAAAKDSSEVLSGNGGGRHRQNSLDKIRKALRCVNYIKSPVNLSTTG